MEKYIVTIIELNSKTEKELEILADEESDDIIAESHYKQSGGFGFRLQLFASVSEIERLCASYGLWDKVQWVMS